MRKVLRIASLILGTLSVSLGSVFMVFAKNSALGTQKISESVSASAVDPVMAILAAIIVAVVGIIAFAKRNLTK